MATCGHRQRYATLKNSACILNNNHNKAREWLATSLPYLRSSLPPFSQLRSARVSSGQLYQPALPNPNVQLYLILNVQPKTQSRKGSGGWENSSRRQACRVLCGVCVLLHFPLGRQLASLSSCSPWLPRGHTYLPCWLRLPPGDPSSWLPSITRRLYNPIPAG